jgi:hypothetical protein
MMLVKEISFRRWNAKDPLKGTITFLNDAGQMELALTEDEVAEITRACTKAMIRVSQDAFARIGAAIEATAKTLPAPA